MSNRKFILLFFCFTTYLQAGEPLSDRLLSTVGEVREEAVKEFNQLPRETQDQFVPTLMVGLSSDDPEVHEQSAALLKKLGAAPKGQTDVPVMPRETSTARKTRDQQSLEEIRQMKTDRYKNLKTELEHEKAQAGISAENAGPEKNQRDLIRDGLLDGLTDPTSFVRSRSARRIANMQPPMVEAIPALIKMLNDTDAECRGSAAGALGSIGPAAHDAIDPLAKLTGDADPNVRGIAHAALQQIRGAP